MLGVYSGLCLPRRRRATSVATRPRTLSAASMTNHSRLIVLGLATKVFMEKQRLWKGADVTQCPARGTRGVAVKPGKKMAWPCEPRPNHHSEDGGALNPG